jgi:hypothetical protein
MTSNRDPGWYWVKLLLDVGQSSWWSGQWTGNEWRFPDLQGNPPPIIDIGSAIAPPSSGQPPSPSQQWENAFYWLKTKAQPDTWQIGFGTTACLSLADGSATQAGNSDLYVADLEPLQTPSSKKESVVGQAFGWVNGSGEVKSGSGNFDVKKIGVGHYYITLHGTSSQTPGVAVTPFDAYITANAIIQELSALAFTVYTGYTDQNKLADLQLGFHFVALWKD